MANMTPQKLKEYIGTHATWSNRRIRSALHRHRLTTAEIEAARGTAGQAVAAQGRKPVADIGQPLTVLMDQYDDVKRVQQKLRELPRDAFEDDDSMRRLCRVTPDRWKIVRDHPKVSGYRFKLPNGKHVWLHPDAQQKLTAAINLERD